jgi:hypothetical protein
MRIFNIPIEPLEERYSTQWIKWFAGEFDKQEIDYTTILPTFRLTSKIETGSFLDVYGTNHFKTLQMAALIEILYRERCYKTRDWIFFHDLWYPGIESLAYIRNGADKHFKIAGCLHAGTWDVHDFLYQKGMMDWGGYFEEAVLTLTDIIFVATEYHKNLICDKHGQRWHRKIHVTGFPIYPETFVQEGEKDERLVVFPHRLDAEKDWQAFLSLAIAMEDEKYKFVMTKRACNTKEEYYKLLSKATFALSFAWQETWGIAMQEALFSGCIPLMPNRLSYMEMYPQELLYKDPIKLERRLRQYLWNTPSLATAKFEAEKARKHLRQLGKNAIPKMIQLMKEHT